MILLDTCAIIWDATDSPKLHSDIRVLINREEKNGQLCICDISFWEVAMLTRKNRLDLGISVEAFFELYQQKRYLNVLPITAQLAEQSVNLDSRMNSDPADRLIVATAMSHNATLITADNNLQAFPEVKTFWR